MRKSRVQNGALITPRSPKISGHFSAGRFQPVCLRPGLFTAGPLTSTQRIVLVFSQEFAVRTEPSEGRSGEASERARAR